MCPLESRVRYAEASLGGHLAGTVPGAAKVQEAEDPIGNGNSEGGAKTAATRSLAVSGGHVASPPTAAPA
jgi:hypothetical protein